MILHFVVRRQSLLSVAMLIRRIDIWQRLLTVIMQHINGILISLVQGRSGGARIFELRTVWSESAMLLWTLLREVPSSCATHFLAKTARATFTEVLKLLTSSLC